MNRASNQSTAWLIAIVTDQIKTGSYSVSKLFHF